MASTDKVSQCVSLSLSIYLPNHLPFSLSLIPALLREVTLYHEFIYRSICCYIFKALCKYFVTYIIVIKC